MPATMETATERKSRAEMLAEWQNDKVARRGSVQSTASSGSQPKNGGAPSAKPLVKSSLFNKNRGLIFATPGTTLQQRDQHSVAGKQQQKFRASFDGNLGRAVPRGSENLAGPMSARTTPFERGSGPRAGAAERVVYAPQHRGQMGINHNVLNSTPGGLAGGTSTTGATMTTTTLPRAETRKDVFHSNAKQSFAKVRTNSLDRLNKATGQIAQERRNTTVGGRAAGGLFANHAAAAALHLSRGTPSMVLRGPPPPSDDILERHLESQLSGGGGARPEFRADVVTGGVDIQRRQAESATREQEAIREAALLRERHEREAAAAATAQAKKYEDHQRVGGLGTRNMSMTQTGGKIPQQQDQEQDQQQFPVSPQRPQARVGLYPSLDDFQPSERHVMLSPSPRHPCPGSGDVPSSIGEVHEEPSFGQDQEDFLSGFPHGTAPSDDRRQMTFAPSSRIGRRTGTTGFVGPPSSYQQDRTPSRSQGGPSNPESAGGSGSDSTYGTPLEPPENRRGLLTTSASEQILRPTAEKNAEKNDAGRTDVGARGGIMSQSFSGGFRQYATAVEMKLHPTSGVNRVGQVPQRLHRSLSPGARRSMGTASTAFGRRAPKKVDRDVPASSSSEAEHGTTTAFSRKIAQMKEEQARQGVSILDRRPSKKGVGPSPTSSSSEMNQQLSAAHAAAQQQRAERRPLLGGEAGRRSLTGGRNLAKGATPAPSTSAGVKNRLAQAGSPNFPHKLNSAELVPEMSPNTSNLSLGANPCDFSFGRAPARGHRAAQGVILRSGTDAPRSAGTTGNTRFGQKSRVGAANHVGSDHPLPRGGGLLQAGILSKAGGAPPGGPTTGGVMYHQGKKAARSGPAPHNHPNNMQQSTDESGENGFIIGTPDRPHDEKEEFRTVVSKAPGDRDDNLYAELSAAAKNPSGRFVGPPRPGGPVPTSAAPVQQNLPAQENLQHQGVPNINQHSTAAPTPHARLNITVESIEDPHRAPAGTAPGAAQEPKKARRSSPSHDEHQLREQLIRLRADQRQAEDDLESAENEVLALRKEKSSVQIAESKARHENQELLAEKRTFMRQKREWEAERQKMEGEKTSGTQKRQLALVEVRRREADLLIENETLKNQLEGARLGAERAEQHASDLLLKKEHYKAEVHKREAELQEMRNEVQKKRNEELIADQLAIATRQLEASHAVRKLQQAQLLSLRSNINLFCRVRPLLSGERALAVAGAPAGGVGGAVAALRRPSSPRSVGRVASPGGAMRGGAPRAVGNNPRDRSSSGGRRKAGEPERVLTLSKDDNQVMFCARDGEVGTVFTGKLQSGVECRRGAVVHDQSTKNFVGYPVFRRGGFFGSNEDVPTFLKIVCISYGLDIGYGISVSASCTSWDSCRAAKNTYLGNSTRFRGRAPPDTFSSRGPTAP